MSTCTFMANMTNSTLHDETHVLNLLSVKSEFLKITILSITQGEDVFGWKHELMMSIRDLLEFSHTVKVVTF